MKIDFHVHYEVSNARFVDQRLRLMDDADVSYSVVHALPHLRFKGSVCGDNEDVSKLVRAYPNRFVGSIHIDPRECASRDTLNRFSGEGFRCVKMWPPLGFYPDSAQFAPVFEQIQELRLPVLFHVGLTSLGTKYDSKYADPIHIEGLLRRYPSTPFILAHWGGLGTFQMSWALMKANGNVYLDGSGRSWSWPGSALYRLYEAVSPIDFQRVVWGTDNLETPSDGIQADGNLLREISKEKCAGDFFGKTAARLLRLD